MPKGTYEQELAHEKRRRNWRHNSLFGAVGMAKANMRTIAGTATASPAACALAASISGELDKLGTLLKERYNG
jgi:hypothetical protein